MSYDSMADHARCVRLVEAILFAAPEPTDEAVLASRLPEGANLRAVLADLAAHYRHRGINLVRIANGWAFRTAPDLAAALRVEVTVQRRLSQAAVETLAIIAYHQPISRAEIEAVRGVATSRGTLDLLIEAGWIRPGKRRDSPGRPLTWITTPAFLDHFGLSSLDELPSVAELRAAGLLDAGPAVTTLPGGRLEGDDEAAGAGEAAPEPDGAAVAQG